MLPAPKWPFPLYFWLIWGFKVMFQGQHFPIELRAHSYIFRISGGWRTGAASQLFQNPTFGFFAPPPNDHSWFGFWATFLAMQEHSKGLVLDNTWQILIRILRVQKDNYNLALLKEMKSLWKLKKEKKLSFPKGRNEALKIRGASPPSLLLPISLLPWDAVEPGSCSIFHLLFLRWFFSWGLCPAGAHYSFQS